jgi:hypothetical protein
LLVALQPTLVGPEQVTTFLEALQISEYSIAFAELLGVVPMSVCEVRHLPSPVSCKSGATQLRICARPQVQHAACWPLEGQGRLEALYCGLLDQLVAAWVRGTSAYWLGLG